MPPTDVVTEAIEWSTRPDDEIYAAIGGWLLDEAFPASPRSARERIQAGRRWWERTMKAIQGEICDDPRVVAARLELDTNPTRLVQTLIDIYSTKSGYPPVANLTGLILKIGIDKICP